MTDAILNAKKLDEVDVQCYINRGPYLTDILPDKLFSDKNKLGSPVEMEMHSSINGFYRFGYVTLYDETGVRESFPLTGNEIITVVYKNVFRDNTGYAALPLIIHFNIFDIEEVIANPDQHNSRKFNGKLLKFHLIEAPFFLKYNDKSWQVAFGKSESYILPKSNSPGVQSNGMLVHDIFYKHMKEHLKLVTDNTKDDMIELDFQKMNTKFHFISPSWKSQKIFSYILEYTKDANDYGNVKFFPTTNIKSSRPIVHLKSLNYMFKDPNNVPTIFSLVDPSAMSNNANAIGMKTLNLILMYKFLMYDLSSLPSGMGGGKLLNYDYSTGKYFTHYDTYTESNKKKGNSYFSNYGLWSDRISNENAKQFYVGRIDKENAVGYLNNKLIKNRHQLRCEMMTYVDEKIQPGDKILVTFPSGMSELNKEQQSHLFDEHMSDEWIVEEIVDRVENGSGARKMTCIKDSFFNVYGKPLGNDSKIYLPQVKYVNGK